MIFDEAVIKMIIVGIGETLYMTFLSTALAYVLGLPLGVVLAITEQGGILPSGPLNKVLNIVVNIIRSVPFLILAIAIMPFTRLIIGTTLGPTATVVSLVIAAFPFVARLVEASINELDGGITDAAISMGSTRTQIIFKVFLPEARPSIITGAAIASTTILGYSAMAGIFGGGGLGDIAIRYGYHRYQSDIMLVTVVLLVVIVQLTQEGGMRLAKKLNKRK